MLLDREVDNAFLFLDVIGVAPLAAIHATPVHTKALTTAPGSVGVLATLNHTLMALMLGLGMPREVLIFGSAFGYLLAWNWLGGIPVRSGCIIMASCASRTGHREALMTSA